MIEKQYELEGMYHRNQQVPKLNALFDSWELFVKDSPQYKSVRKFCVQLIVQRRVRVDSMLGMLAKDIELEEAAQLVEELVGHGLAKFDQLREELVVSLDAPPEVLTEMELYMFPPPLVTQPLEVTKNTESGWHTVSEPVMAKRAFTHEDVCLDVINIMNSFKFVIDPMVLGYSSRYASLDVMKEGETRKEYNKREKAWRQFDTKTRQLVEQHYKDGFIWFGHKYDSRGRMYCKGHHLNYQGASWSKMLIQHEPMYLEEY